MLIVVIAVGLLLFVPLFIYLSVKVGFKPTLGVFTIGLRPRQRHRQPDGIHRKCAEGDPYSQVPHE